MDIESMSVTSNICIDEEFSDDWFAIRVNPNCERSTVSSLKAKGYESFVPLCREFRNWANRVRKVERAIFQGYVFCQFDPAVRLPILTTPGVAQIVGTSSGPVAVDPRELSAIRRIANSFATPEPWPFLTAGVPVTIDAGPFRGISGRLVSTRSSLKVVVSVTLLQRSVAVEVDRSWIHPTNEYLMEYAVSGAQ